MKKKKAKYVAKKGRSLTAKQTKKIRGGMALPVVRRQANVLRDAKEGAEGMRRWEGPPVA